MRVAAYYRVSTTQQRDAQTIASQRTAARALVAARGWELAAEFEDDGRSARTGLKRRTGFLALLEAARTRGFEAVIVVAFDRLTRAEDLGEMGSILGTLQTAGVRVVTASGEETDLGTFGGRITALVQAQLSARESEIKSDRARRGRERVAAAGRPPCAPPLGFAFDRVGGEWKESEAGDLVREVVGRVAGGESCQAVAADLLERAVPLPRGGRWCAASVVRIVRCEAYSSGQWVANKGVAIAVPVLVDPTLAAAARARLAAYRLRGLRRTIHHWLLEAIARCGVCDSPIRIHGNVSRRESKTHNYWYYVCERNRRRMPGGRCSLPSRRADLLDAEVWATVVAWIEQPDLLRSGLAAQSGAACDEGRQALADLDEWRRRAGALVEVELEALRLRERGLLSAPALAARLGETARKRALLERQIATAEGMARDASAASIAAAGLATAAEDLRRGAARADRSERQRLVRLVCDAWTIDETEVRGLGAIGAATRELVVVAR